MTTEASELGTAAFYAAAAARLRPDPFIHLRHPGQPLGEVIFLDWRPGDDTEYQLMIARRTCNLAVAVLNCERRCGILPFDPWDLHEGYVQEKLNITNLCTLWAVTAVVNRATEVCLGRPTVADGGQT